MGADFLQRIDWSRPWLAPYRELGCVLAAAADWRGCANARAAGIRNSRGLQVRFVPQSSLPEGVSYEAYIAETGQVPTRENLHDFFNALVWLTFPRTKVQLNARQAAELEQAANRPTSRRGRVRDAATLFDENAAVLVVRDPGLLAALRAHRWFEVFVGQRARFAAGCEVVLFGHALLEKLVTPYKSITAHAWPIVDDAFFSQPAPDQLSMLDLSTAGDLHGTLDTSRFTPLPVLGVPGWWEHQDEAFYADPTVFRPLRARPRS
ncbi:MAG TPA: DUF3025 domain-containing protein [Noviherbaspirillum sp.]|jgi:hypothetical protein|uniref:DUF3025 domain-containing protein n=1 Tax=Noviherbaspirillum sp. TaxID=1926288 RepID=UPI002F9367D7